MAAVATDSRPFQQWDPEVPAVLSPVRTDENERSVGGPLDDVAPTPPFTEEPAAPVAPLLATAGSQPVAAPKSRKPRLNAPGRRAKAPAVDVPEPVAAAVAAAPVAAPFLAPASISSLPNDVGATNGHDQADLGWDVDESAPVDEFAPLAAFAPGAPVAPTAPDPVAPAPVTSEPSAVAEPVVPSPAQPQARPTTPSWPDRPLWPPQRSIDAVATPVESHGPRVPAGAYLPPSAVLPPGEALPLASAATAPAAAAAPGPSLTDDLRRTLGDSAMPFGLPTDAPTRIVILGAGIAALGFLLPWADIVIGSGSIGGYLEQWGLAGPGHIIVLGLVLALAALALTAARLPRWVRLGLPSIAVAFLLGGLVWPYLMGPFNTSIGVYVVAVGALVMVTGGLLDRIATRHVETTARV